MSGSRADQSPPCFRTDLEILEDLSGNQPARYLVKCPAVGEVFQISARELFLCQSLDGQTDLDTLCQRFQARFHASLPRVQLEALVQQLADLGLLAGVAANPAAWSAGNPPPARLIGGERFFSVLDGLFGWLFTPLARASYAVVCPLGLGVIASHWSELVFALSQLVDTLRYVANLPGGPDWPQWLWVGLLFWVLPSLRELLRSVACRRYWAIPVNRISYTWFIGLIPYIVIDWSAINQPRYASRQLAIVTLGMKMQLVVLCAAALAWELLGASSPEKTWLLNLAIAAAISLFINAMPFGKRDASLALAIQLGIVNFRRRAVRVSRAWLRGRPLPEPLSPGEWRLFCSYGLLADLYQGVFNATLFGLGGYLLISWLEGPGALLLAGYLALKLGSGMRSIVMATVSRKGSRISDWLKPLGVLGGLIAVGLIPYPRDISGEFRVLPSQQREVRAEVSAQIEAIAVDEGQWVEPGQVLVKLIQRLIQNELDTTLQALAREQSRLRDLEGRPKPEDIAVAEQQVKVAQTTLKHSLKTYQRQVTLWASGDIAEGDYDTALRQMEVDRETLALRQRALAQVQSGPTAAEIATQQAEVRRLQEAVRHLQDDLRRTTIVSPLAGQVVTLYLRGKEGQLANVGDVVAVVAQTRTVLLRIALPEEYAAEVQIGAAVRAKTWASPGQVWYGRVQRVAPVVVDKAEDVRQRTKMEQDQGRETQIPVRSLNAPVEDVMPVLVEIDNNDHTLKVGMSGYAKIEVGWHPLALVFLDPIIRFLRVRVWSWLP